MGRPEANVAQILAELARKTKEVGGKALSGAKDIATAVTEAVAPTPPPPPAAKSMLSNVSMGHILGAGVGALGAGYAADKVTGSLSAADLDTQIADEEMKFYNLIRMEQELGRTNYDPSKVTKAASVEKKSLTIGDIADKLKGSNIGDVDSIFPKLLASTLAMSGLWGGIQGYQATAAADQNRKTKKYLERALRERLATSKIGEPDEAPMVIKVMPEKINVTPFHELSKALIDPAKGRDVLANL